jgi:hypothetical protein
MLRERDLATLLATLVARLQESADLALARGDLGAAASLEESCAMATHRLGLFEDAMLAVLRGRREGTWSRWSIASSLARPRAGAASRSSS